MSTERMPIDGTPHHASVGGDSVAATRWLRLLGRLTVCCRRLRTELADCARKHDIGEGEFLLLWHCRGAMPEGVDQSELAALAAVSPSQVSGRVEALRRANLLEAVRDSADRRRQVWRLTAAGARLVNAVLADLEPLARCHIARWGEESSEPIEQFLAAGLDVARASSDGAVADVIPLPIRGEASNRGAATWRQRRAGGAA